MDAIQPIQQKDAARLRWRVRHIQGTPNHLHWIINKDETQVVRTLFGRVSGDVPHEGRKAVAIV